LPLRQAARAARGASSLAQGEVAGVSSCHWLTPVVAGAPITNALRHRDIEKITRVAVGRPRILKN
ncbi:MAG: hypothetical protein L0387_12375, partial [Acidobacteria bacterium]|nr:hypothetical protein [Acidobacteriota bacterium]MCI0721336.1 hypothetical protein [Acidobacteriota bacterium]